MSRFRQQFEYYLNVIYYVMHNIAVNRNRVFQYLTSRVCIYAVCLIFKGQKRRKYIRHFINIQMDANTLFFNRENGVISHSAKKFFVTVFGSYSIFPLGIMMIISGEIENNQLLQRVWCISYIILCVGLVYICANIPDKAVFSRDKYLYYAKIFDAKDKAWHIKSIILTIFFVVGVIITVLLLVFLMGIFARLQKGLPPL